MPLYRWGADNLEAISPTTFEAEQLQERGDLQRLLRDQPDALEKGLFVVAEEFGDWEDSNRRIDLLALDSEGRLVVIELKRTQSGDLSELQAIRYAAMVSNMTLERIIDAHRDYLAKRSQDEDARKRVLEHLEVEDESDAEINTERPRIVLASAGFSTELTTSVLWLRDSDIDISCVRLQLYRSGEGLLLDTSQVIPLPEASDYYVKVQERQNEQKQHRSGGVRSPGGEVFKAAIDSANEQQREELTKMHSWATKLAAEGLADLYSFAGKDTTLNIRVRDKKNALVTLYISSTFPPIRLWRERFENYASNSLRIIEELINARLGSQGFHQYNDGLLDALTDAYREANGLPPISPPPGSGPGSLPMEDC